ncbi:hypothetical protein F0562_005138 [Nyssa sinensis]|uniref:NAC domain-containing protein n=1 Tax=Nyssa sinensis TaxID=561372 RepID=A0A5J5AJV2_9ASTE|nr:hypothetical protein F0562_005138 [Nyssa sinensis]
MPSSSLNIPSGYKFCPTDTEIVIHYLKRKILDQQLPADIIPTADVYSKNPRELPLSKFKYSVDNEWYFFSTRLKDNRFTTGYRYTTDGYWHSILNENILDEDDEVIIGFVEMLTFYERKPLQVTKTNWLMQEYRISELVICKIFRAEDDPGKCLEVLGMEDDPERFNPMSTVVYNN